MDAHIRGVLDTNVLIDGILNLPHFSVAVSSVSYAELEWGITSAADDEMRAIRAARLDRFRARLGPGLAFDDAAAQSFGRIAALLRARGRSPRGRVIDLMIAAVAHSNDAVIITRNVKDFAGLDGLVEVVKA